jgi:hypothetical protein
MAPEGNGVGQHISSSKGWSNLECHQPAIMASSYHKDDARLNFYFSMDMVGSCLWVTPVGKDAAFSPQHNISFDII